MKLHVVEAAGNGNWGKFAVGRPGPGEWAWRSTVGDAGAPLLTQVGWGREHVWVWDLQTGEGAIFRPGGYAKADLEKHRVWVCPLFAPFLEWLYTQDLSDLDQLPRLVDLAGAEFAFTGYRRRGPDT